MDGSRAAIEAIVLEMFKLAIDPIVAPRITFDSGLIGQVMFSNGRLEKCDDRKPELLQDRAHNPRMQQIRGKIRTPLFEGKPVPKMKAFNLRDAIFEAWHTGSVSTPPWWRLAKKIVTGAAHSPCTADLRRLSRTIVFLMLQSPKQASWGQRLAMHWTAGGRSPS